MDLFVPLVFAIRRSRWFSFYESANQKWLTGFLASLGTERNPSELFNVIFDGVYIIKGISRFIHDSNVPKLTVIYDSKYTFRKRKDEKELRILKKELSVLVSYTRQWNRVLSIAILFIIFTFLFLQLNVIMASRTRSKT
jgi:hypothetical protein